jgi:hypothetical protein
MAFDSLATELLLQIFSSCSSFEDLNALALSCSRFHKILTSPQRLSILSNVAEAQYGPLRDAIQVVTYNDSQPAYVPREAHVSYALLQQLLEVGRVASAWEDIYPAKKWNDDNFEDRRLLTDNERYRLRQAVYRLWLYNKAFHNAQHPRETRCMAVVGDQRAKLLRNWSVMELADMADVHQVMRDVLTENICPSNRVIREKLGKYLPDGPQYHTVFNSPYQNSPSQAGSQYHQFFHHFSSPSKYLDRFLPTDKHEPGSEGWGDEIPYYYIVEDMLKLDPGQILWLWKHAPYKSQVLRYVRDLGDWFDDNGQTFGQTLERLMLRRNGDSYDDLRAAIAEGEVGIIAEA